MRVEAIIPVWTDDCNSFPPDLKVEVHDNYIEIKLEGPERKITIKKSEFQALMKFINLGGNE